MLLYIKEDVDLGAYSKHGYTDQIRMSYGGISTLSDINWNNVLFHKVGIKLKIYDKERMLMENLTPNLAWPIKLGC